MYTGGLLKGREKLSLKAKGIYLYKYSLKKLEKKNLWGVVIAYDKVRKNVGGGH